MQLSAVKKGVTLIKTLQKNEMLDGKKSGSYKLKPKLIVGYNNNMGLINQICRYNFLSQSVKLKSGKSRFFWHLFDVNVLNSYIIYKLKMPKVQLSEFKLNLICQLFERHWNERGTLTAGQRSHDIRLQTVCITGCHFPVPPLMDSTENNNFKGNVMFVDILHNDHVIGKTLHGSVRSATSTFVLTFALYA